nr:hypothetical protein [Bradyrhizobium sp. CCBAU 45389]
MTERYLAQTPSLEQRLAREAVRLRMKAQGTPPGVERERIIRRSRQIENALHINEWLRSPGLQPLR